MRTMGLQGSVRSHKPLSGRPKRGATGSIVRVRVGSAGASRFLASGQAVPLAGLSDVPG